MKNITRGIFLITLSFLFFSFCFGQKETNHWYFGNSKGLDFSFGEPILDINNNMSADWGCSVISDSSGNLLFYTNGKMIWNKLHEIMPNGNLGDSCVSESNQQSCIILPFVGSADKYYIFTVDPVYAGNKGLRYTIVDMSLDSGNGDVITKGVFIKDSLFEGCVATQHFNGIDFWVMVRSIYQENGYGQFYAYKVDSNGINNPVITQEGEQYNSDMATGKFSPNGQYLFWKDGIYDFNKANGNLSNYRSLGNTPYCVGEFSPNNQVFYATYMGSSAFHIDQFDLSLSILADQGLQLDDVTWIKKGMQLGPNGKIYIMYQWSLGVINDPNVLGLGCNLVQNSISCGDPGWDFPNFSSHYFSSLHSMSINNIDKKNDVNFYYSPNERSLNINVENVNDSGMLLSIYNSIGQLMIVEHFDRGSDKVLLDNLSKGLYIISLHYNDYKLVSKFIVY